MPDPIWTAVDDYFAAALLPPDAALDAVQAASARAGLPAIAVSPAQGKLLALLVRMAGARRVLEIGTLGGYSTIWMARALPAGGKLVTLELDAKHAAVARANFDAAGVADRVELREGRATDTLAALVDETAGPFDFVFIDADKAGAADYFDYALKLTRPGATILVDNVVRGGKIADPASADESVRGIRRLVQRLAGEPRVEATALQTVGGKSYDGFLLARVVG